MQNLQYMEILVINNVESLVETHNVKNYRIWKLSKIWKQTSLTVYRKIIGIRKNIYRQVFKL